VNLAAAITERYAEGGAGFMHDLGLTVVDAEPGRVRFTLKVTEHLVHGGGVLCGQTILACMDTGMVFVMMSLRDAADTQFTTVQLNTVFERGVPDDVGEVTFVAFATKTGRTLVFGQIDLLLPDGRRAASATTTYMWL
jgi:acyl-coenzyme A thioesterase PaaI-like protein